MKSLLPALLLTSTLGGCVLDRTGRSASEAWHREMLLQQTRTGNLEALLANLSDRTSQLEELTRARGQDEIMRMETLEQVRTEVANLRGEIELLSHDMGKRVTDTQARAADAAFRLQWLEDRAAQLEKSLGVKPTPAPVMALLSGNEQPPDTAGDTGEPDPTGSEEEPEESVEVTEPGAMMDLAKEHLAGGRPKVAEAVLKRFIELHPKDANLPEARYRLAEAAFNAADYQQAVLRFQDVIDKHKSSNWAPWAMLRQGECFEKQGQKENARLFYEDVVRMWPKSQAAKDARGRL
jgi:tol-pal system protein YbgF